tara:strand:+ start:150 stop:1385 length:1236 start_codon:yes stop_codon:yes gene_type:complete
MKNRILSEELKRFSEIINYDPAHILNESGGKITDDIIEKLEPSLPLSNTTSDLESIILLQKTLVDLGKLNKNYGIDGDGVDGDFGGDTKDALVATISDTSLTKNNINEFKDVLEDNEDKVKNTISKYDTFLEKFKEQAGVSLEYLETCNKKTNFKDLKFIPKVNKCHLNVDIAKTLNELFPDESTITKSAILSVMMKEQGKGKHICAPNNNYAGVQTDSGGWGEKSKLFNDQFCAKDKERVRSFASFNNLEDGLEFIKQAFVDKGWFITLLKDVDDESVDLEETELEKISKKNAEIWQTKWNLDLNDDDWKRFKKYGYNPNQLDKSFSDSRGIYTKKVSDFTEKEKTLHNNNDKNYRAPEDIDKSLNSVGKYYKDAYEIFKDLKPNTEVEDNVGTNGENRNIDIQTRSTNY